MKAMIDPSFWSDPDFQNIEDGDMLYIYIYLISNKENNSLGVYRISKRQIAFETRKSIESIERALKGLSDTVKPTKIMYDDKSGWMWVKGSFTRNYRTIPHVNLRINVCKQLKSLEVSDFPFMAEFTKKHKDIIKAFESPIGRDNVRDNSNDTYTTSFIEFWSEYPRKIGKGKAFDSWQKLNCDAIKDKIIKAVQGQRTCEQWRKDNGQFIPHPSTWLNQKRWEDELGIKPASKPSKAKGEAIYDC